MDGIVMGSGPQTPASPASTTTGEAQSTAAKPSRGRDQTQLRKQIVSVGKQPKAQSKRRKDMVSELFDSLTPDAHYFDGSRRKRNQPKTYNDEEYEKPTLSELAATGGIEAGVDDGRVSPASVGSKYGSSSTSKKGRKRHREDSERSYADELDRPLTPTEMIKERNKHWQEILNKRREKLNRRRLMKQYIEDPDELVENESFSRFCRLIDKIFETYEEYDIAVGEEDDEIPPECLIAKKILTELCEKAGKMKSMGVTARVPVDRLVKLLTILEKNVRDAIQLFLVLDPEKEEDEEDEAYRELVSERVFRSADAALTALTIMTSAAMPKQVYIEDAIERSIQLVKNQLTNVIYPAYDAQYRIEKKKKETGSGGKGRGKKGAGHIRNKNVKSLYSRMVELLSCFAELVEIQPLTDTAVVQLTNLAVGPFFVEGISELQLNSLRLATAIFKKYEKHRDVILQDILGSLHRLPQGKGSRHTYRLNSEEYIQMITALVLQLVQSVVEVPSSRKLSRLEEDLDDEYDPSMPRRPHRGGAQAQPALQEADVTVQTSFDQARTIANRFLGAFLSKCTARSEDDYRHLFDVFLQDLLKAVHKPEWPSAEILLTLLGSLLVQHFRNKQHDMTLRVASLDYLGTVAAKLRRDSVLAQLDENTVNEIVSHLTEEDEDDDDFVRGNRHKRHKNEEPSEDKMQILQRALVDYLLDLRDGDATVEYARQFYIAQWYKDRTVELERILKGGRKENSSGEDVGSRTAAEQADCQRAIQQTAATKQFLLTLVDREDELDAMAAGGYGRFGREEPALSEEHASFIVKYLASKRQFSQSFETYLFNILRVLNEKTNAVGIRTKAMKCLALVVEADPGVLTRADVKNNVYAKLLDNASSVREAAVDLLGKYILAKPELIDQYYSMLLNRILDTGVSVRKRVIKIMKEICEKRSDSDKIPEICSQMIKRVNDEEGIRKLVNETFHSLWFTPCRERDTATLLKKVVTITDVVGNSKKEPALLEFLSHLLSNLFKQGDKAALNSSRQIVDCLVEHVLTLDSKTEDSANQERLLDCLTTLFLFSQVRPELLLKHAETLEPYLKISSTIDPRLLTQIQIKVVQILKRVIPLMDHPSDKFLSDVELSLLSIMKTAGSAVLIEGCCGCISAVVRKQKRNMKPVMDEFIKYCNFLALRKEDIEVDQNIQLSDRDVKWIARSVYTVGVLCKCFDFDSVYPEDRRPEISWNTRVFELLIFFANDPTEMIRSKALSSLGQFCSYHAEYLMRHELKSLYHSALISTKTDPKTISLKVLILTNIELFLKEEERKMSTENDEWQEKKKTEALMDMNEAQSGLGSTVIQLYLKEVQKGYLVSVDLSVRQASTRVTVLTLQQGLVTPGASIPTLISMSTDPDMAIRNLADNQLKEIDSKYQGFVLSKAIDGLRMCFRLHRNLLNAEAQRKNLTHPERVRGYRLPTTDERQKYASNALMGPNAEGSGNPVLLPGIEALLGFLYTLIRDKKANRRSFLANLIRRFDENFGTPLEELVFVADNLAHLPYLIQDEPLYVMHLADTVISLSGASLLQTFKDNLLPRFKRGLGGPEEYEDEDDLTQEQLFIRLPSNLEPLHECIKVSLGCFLLLYLKSHLKMLYGINDTKIQEYSPNESGKAYDKSLSRKANVGSFFPEEVLLELDPRVRQMKNSQNGRLRLCSQYLRFRQMMMTLDTGTGSEDDENTNDGAGVTSGVQNSVSPAPDVVGDMEG